MEGKVISPGHRACAGCGAVLAMRYVLEMMGDDVILVIPACCWSIIGGPYPYTPLKQTPTIHCLFAAAGAVATGVKRGSVSQDNEHTKVIAFAGDGGTFDIGLQCLSGAAERNEDIIFVCYDNEAYMNTGIQRSSATPWGAVTTTTPYPEFEKRPKKNILEIVASHRSPYVASASLGFLDDLKRKIAKAKETKGFRFLHIFSPCPTGWGHDPKDTIKIARLAVQTGIFPLREIENGEKYTLNFNPPIKLLPEEYFRLQKRFSHLTEEDIKYIKEYIGKEWKRLVANH